MHHENNGHCETCLTRINRYPNFNKDLLMWFQIFQAKYPEAHISCAGRGREDQELMVAQKRSKAHWGFSAHNYNCAIDLFIEKPGMDIYDKTWFETILAPEIPDFLNWYGKPGSIYFELPHVEIRNWRDLLAEKKIELVEPIIYQD